ncbi:MAG: hypothetical protein RLZZ303_198 [Candidatus Hydrogenedentota bacterium]
MTKSVLLLALALLPALGAFSQEAGAPAGEASSPPPPARDYLLAFAAPTTPEALAAVLSEYAQSDASLLLLAPQPWVAFTAEQIQGVEKPVLAAPYYCDAAPIQVVQGKEHYLVLCQSPSGAGVAQLHEARRAHRAGRWSVGLAARHEPMDDLRLTLALFVDDPIDYLFVAQSSVLLGAAAAKHPLGRTVVYGPAPPEAPALLFFAVAESGITPYTPPASEAAPEAAPEP